MTQDEFLKKYHGYIVTSEKEARIEAQKITVENDGVEVVTFDAQYWCLMLSSVYNELIEQKGRDDSRQRRWG